MNWEAFTRFASLDIQLHWATVTIAFFAGLLQLVLSKGGARHRVTGRVYAGMMIATSVAAFFIRSPAPDDAMGYLSLTGMSPIHLFIPLTLFTVTAGVFAARRGNIRAHKRHMVGSFLGALVIAGAFTFIPGRRMHLLFFGDEATVAQWDAWYGGD